MTFASLKFIKLNFTKDIGEMPSIYPSDIDRRSTTDRRRVYDLDYFQNGGIERRKKKERRSRAGVREMTWYEMPLYYVKYHEKDDWVEISELKLMDQLYQSFNKVTPAIKEMLTGKEIKTEHGIYKLILNGNHQS
jgi:hypothetical protein